MRKLHRKRAIIGSRDSVTLKRLFEYRVRYGLRNKAQYARAAFLVKKYRRLVSEGCAKKMSDAVVKLKGLGILKGAQSLLDIGIDDFLNARLQSVVSRKQSVSMRHARHLITMGKVIVAKKTVRYPSFMPRVCHMESIGIRGNK